MTTALAEPALPQCESDADPFRIGYRYVHEVGPDGQKSSVMVPLTEEDFLHPQEEDRFLLTDAHSIGVYYLRHALSLATRGRRELRVFSEHRIDWQVPGIPPHGPDVVAFDRFTADWDPLVGTLPVADLSLDTLAVFEVTSEATRHVDLGRKFDEFERVGIPYFLVADLAAPNGVPVLLGFELDDGRYRLMDEDPTLGYFVPRLAVWVRLQDDRLVVADESGRDIPNSLELATALEITSIQVEAEKATAEAERQRANAEKATAEAERERANAEKATAEAERERANAEKATAETERQKAIAEKATAEAERERANAEKARADAEQATAEAERQRADELARELAELKARLAGG